jgi:DNA-binding NarL/FixJ family response regulator
MPNFQRTIVVVEDELFIQSLVANGLRSRGFKVETASTAAEARKVISKVNPDAVLLDIDLGQGANGLDVGEALLAQSPDIAVVYLTVLSDPRLAGGSVRKINPRAAYLNKKHVASVDAVVQALEAVLHETNVASFRDDQSHQSATSKLSNTQLEVLGLITQGLTNQQIAEKRGKSRSATEALISRTFEALGISAEESLNARVVAARAYLEDGGMEIRVAEDES